MFPTTSIFDLLENLETKSLKKDPIFVSVAGFEKDELTLELEDNFIVIESKEKTIEGQSFQIYKKIFTGNLEPEISYLPGLVIIKFLKNPNKQLLFK